MITLGVVQCFGLVIAGAFTGVFAIRGDVFCSAPLLIYFLGAFGLGETKNKK